MEQVWRHRRSIRLFNLRIHDVGDESSSMFVDDISDGGDEVDLFNFKISRKITEPDHVEQHVEGVTKTFVFFGDAGDEARHGRSGLDSIGRSGPDPIKRSGLD